MVTLDEYHTHIFSKEFRIAYYCGNIQPTTITLTDTMKNKCSNYTMFEKNPALMTQYHTELLTYFNMIIKHIDTNKYFMYSFGDYIDPLTIPHLIKARFAYYHQRGVTIPSPIEGTTHTLLRLNTDRHWSLVHKVQSNDIPFHDKKNTLIWRGSSTGSRHKKIEFLQHHPNKNIDIKFRKICQGVDPKKFILAPSLSMKQLLEHKYILSMEGNDVASDLKWLLYSNSVVFMRMPRKCTWAMEDLLIPSVHYILLKDDYSDLEEKYNWAMKNLAKCNEIAQNGKQFIQHFLNEQNEMDITKEVMLRYMNNVNIKTA